MNRININLNSFLVLNTTLGLTGGVKSKFVCFCSYVYNNHVKFQLNNLISYLFYYYYTFLLLLLLLSLLLLHVFLFLSFGLLHH